MGQYYMAVLGNEFGTDCKVFNRSVDGEYTFAKLLEHSWWENSFVNSFSERLYNELGRVIWCGDYADEPDDFAFPNCSASYIPCYREVWGDKVQMLSSTSTNFKLDDKFLINYDMKQYVDLNEYKEKSIDKHGWCIHPLTLITAVGNGRGGRDFHEGNIGFEHVGIWAWHLLTISDAPEKDFTKLNLVFIEKRTQ
ncbi:MAG: hypothetical protein IJQ82_12800 [Selenomonadaceae bacterium]|nr:hypothetical protein [Selenomonadaceae bacterium]